jgi:hypothetical protein
VWRLPFNGDAVEGDSKKMCHPAQEEAGFLSPQVTSPAKGASKSLRTVPAPPHSTISAAITSGSGRLSESSKLSTRSQKMWSEHLSRFTMSS